MNTADLNSLLNTCNASRANRQRVSIIVINNPSLMSPLLEIAFSSTQPIASKACWIVEYVSKKDLSLLFNHIDNFMVNLHKLKVDSSIRPMAKICEILTLSFFQKKQLQTRQMLTEKHFEIMTASCFDWLIGNYKVASKAYAMTSLYYLGEKIDWIRPELILILEQDYAAGSAAYKARARQILGLLKKNK